ncbi:MAG: cobyric acid synthase [SAR324 cluster bacterium]|nr:cobyric acid synthase [SAR324 cluster bacterium]
MAKTISIFGTGSDVGKSLLTAGILRLLVQNGYAAAPFKAQNMSNNSFVTKDGLEMGRAQVNQAHAAKIEPDVLMNPVLLKPSSDQTSQVILMGKPQANLKARDFLTHKLQLKETALAAFAELSKSHDYIVIEGAGSLAEVNLRERDIANMGLAQEIKSPVIMVADIDRGGVFAQIVGSLEVLSPEDRALIKGVIINRFRGDISLFESGKKWLEEKTGLPILGIIPFFQGLKIPAEDSVSLETITDLPQKKYHQKNIKKQVAIIKFPRISNFTDFEPLLFHEALDCHYLEEVRDLSSYDLLILPGSKSTINDLKWVKDSGWEDEIKAFHSLTKPILGVCGGFQMLGLEVLDPMQIESSQKEATGLCLLPMTTEIQASKTLRQVEGNSTPYNCKITGYEIHQGTSKFTENVAPFYFVSGEPKGLYNSKKRIIGTYLHGIFNDPNFLNKFLQLELGLPPNLTTQVDPYDKLAKELAPHLDLEKLIKILEDST